MIFYPTEDYLIESLEKGNRWGQDYTWDEVISLRIPEEDEYYNTPFSSSNVVDQLTSNIVSN